MYSFYESVRSKKFGRTSTNMYLQYKWDTENFANHRHKVKTAKPSIDNSAPLTYTHMFVRPKKLQLELERYSTIQRNNRLLLERLATIQREGAWIDNKNDDVESRSLNTWKRQQEMIHLAHNNQIMIARLHDVNALHNRTKLEDEYLINQKYKANIQKWPPNWRELHKHLSRVKADIFKKVFDSKYQTEAYRKSRKRALQKWVLEKERLAAEKDAKSAKEVAEAEKKEQIAQEERKKVSKQHKENVEQRLKSSEKWRSERDERLKKRKEEQEKKIKEAKEEKLEIQNMELKRRQKLKEEIEQWRRKKNEEKDKKEKENVKTKLNRGTLNSENQQTKAKPQYSTGSTGFDVEEDGTQDEYNEGMGSSISHSERDVLTNEKTEEKASNEKSPKAEETTFGEEDQAAQQTTSEHEDLTNNESTSDYESSIPEGISSDDENSTAEEAISNQENSTENMSGSERSASEQSIRDEDEATATEKDSSDDDNKSNK